MTFVDLTYTSFLVPISIGFDTIQGQKLTWLTITDIAGSELGARLLQSHSSAVP